MSTLISRRGRRRGVLLLLVLALLSMFGLLAISFVVITGQAKRSGEALSRAKASADPHIGGSSHSPTQVLSEGIFQVLRGTNNPASVLAAHSLLEDVYGNAPLQGTVTGVNLLCMGQLINLVTNVDALERVGSVLTVTTPSSPAHRFSFRIVGFDRNTNTIQVLNDSGYPLFGPDGKPGQRGVDDNTNTMVDELQEYLAAGSDDLVLFRVGDQFTINGAPFSGTGFGFNTATSRADALDSTFNQFLALQPNYLYNNPAALANSSDPFLSHGANEDYDAADYQSMLLGMILPNGAVIPSLHRPELVQYWQNFNAGTPWNNPDFQRRVVLRPLPNDHPSFPSIDLVNGPWDVDNDGDGIADSIWVDLGLPVRPTKDGRFYKPLFAILCLDMDGRLNLNAHGNYLQADRNADGTAPPPGTPSYYGPVMPNAFSGDWGNTFFFSQGGTPWLPRGFGYGPADVNLIPLFGSQGAAAIANYVNLLAGRYGIAGVPGSPQDDYREQNKWYEFGGAYWNGTAADTGAYGSPPNRLTQGAVGLDPGGRPLYCGLGSLAEKPFDPHKMNLLKPPPVNSPFTVAELERLLRQYDIDAARLPGQRLVGQLGLQGQARNITTESWDIPCPAAASVEALVLRLAVRHANNPNPPPAAVLWARQNAPALLPFELLAGRRMDVNRPFGNGRDDNNNGIVDEPLEALGEMLLQKTALGVDVPVPFNHTNEQTNRPLMVRQLYARYLYVLALLAMEDDYFPSWISGGSPNQRVRARARWIAQWAVNVVDFRDRDSIMTMFEYDPEPFDADGWSADGDPSTDDGITGPHVVWGCERPELLITETLATHGRRVLNAQNVGPGQWTPGEDVGNPPANWDKDFDQTVRPEGSLFIELYHPWSPLEPRPAEFRLPADPAGLGVRLDKTAPNGDPVWRMTIVAPSDMAKDPDADPSFPNNDRAAVLRSVYFAQRPAGYTDDGDVHFSPNPNTSIPPIAPGQYCILGPGRDFSNNGKYVTCFGRLQSSDPTMDPDMSSLGATRRIVLDPAAAGGVPVFSNSQGPPPDPSAAEIQPVLSVVIDQPHRLNISHPNDDYAAISGMNPLPADRPWDYDRTYDAANDPFARPINGKPPFLREGTTTQVAVVHLQRLADPTRPYNAQTNPYRTIDSAMIDLVAFNGWDVKDVPPNPNEMDSPVEDGTVMFATNQRGVQNTAADGTNNIWVQHLASSSLNPTPAETGTPNYFGFDLQHSLGYLNRTYTTNRITTGPHRGDPADVALPWLTWNNRPFASPLEVLLVPAASSSTLLNTAITSPYVQGNTSWPALAFTIDPNGSVDPINNETGPFRHMLNFFHSEPAGTSPPAAPGFYRLLEVLGVPSPFVGTEVQVADPTQLADPSNVHAMYPPFNLSTIYREPGRVNLNTITSETVWQGLMNSIADIGGNFQAMGLGRNDFFNQRFAISRRGYTGGDWWEATNVAYPSRFANPFRSHVGARLNPVPPPALQNAEVNATLLRADPVSPNTPLFAMDMTPAVPPNVPKNRLGEDVFDCVDPNRNPFFRYQPLTRLGNLVTTRSNVYAVWITVGYFEVEPNPNGVDAAHPDGYRLGRELGSDGGDIKRHRGFFLIDRSIPVGFVRGMDYNVGNTILLSRFIE